MNTTCPTMVYRGSGWHGQSCGNNAKYEHEGVMYCKLHHPPTVKAKADEKTAKWNAKVDRRIAANQEAEQKTAEQKRRAECFPDLLKALQRARDLMVEIDGYEVSGPSIQVIDAAIAKATGEQQ